MENACSCIGVIYFSFHPDNACCTTFIEHFSSLCYTDRLGPMTKNPSDRTVRLFTRNKNEYTEKYTEVVEYGRRCIRYPDLACVLVYALMSIITPTLLHKLFMYTCY